MMDLSDWGSYGVEVPTPNDSADLQPQQQQASDDLEPSFDDYWSNPCSDEEEEGGNAFSFDGLEEEEGGNAFSFDGLEERKVQDVDDFIHNPDDDMFTNARVSTRYENDEEEEDSQDHRIKDKIQIIKDLPNPHAQFLNKPQHNSQPHPQPTVQPQQLNKPHQGFDMIAPVNLIVEEDDTTSLIFSKLKNSRDQETKYVHCFKADQMQQPTEIPVNVARPHPFLPPCVKYGLPEDFRGCTMAPINVASNQGCQKGVLFNLTSHCWNGNCKGDCEAALWRMKPKAVIEPRSNQPFKFFSKPSLLNKHCCKCVTDPTHKCSHHNKPMRVCQCSDQQLAEERKRREQENKKKKKSKKKGNKKGGKKEKKTREACSAQQYCGLCGFPNRNWTMKEKVICMVCSRGFKPSDGAKGCDHWSNIKLYDSSANQYIPNYKPPGNVKNKLHNIFWECPKLMYLSIDHMHKKYEKNESSNYLKLEEGEWIDPSLVRQPHGKVVNDLGKQLDDLKFSPSRKRKRENQGSGQLLKRKRLSP